MALVLVAGSFLVVPVDFLTEAVAFFAALLVVGAFLAVAFVVGAFGELFLVAAVVVFLAAAAVRFGAVLVAGAVLVVGAFLAALFVAGAFFVELLVAGDFFTADFAAPSAFLPTVAEDFFALLLAALTALPALETEPLPAEVFFGVEVFFPVGVLPADLVVAFFCAAGTCASLVRDRPAVPALSVEDDPAGLPDRSLQPQSPL